MSSSTDSGLVSSGLDSLVFDRQLVGQVPGSSHPHPPVPSHVLQQVLHPPPGPPPPIGVSSGVTNPPQQQPSLQSHHALHHHHHHHSHHQQQTQQPSLQSLLQPPIQPPPTQQQTSSLPSPSPGHLVAATNIPDHASDTERPDSDHPTLQQLLASAATPLIHTSHPPPSTVHHHDHSSSTSSANNHHSAGNQTVNQHPILNQGLSSPLISTSSSRLPAFNHTVLVSSSTTTSSHIVPVVSVRSSNSTKHHQSSSHNAKTTNTLQNISHSTNTTTTSTGVNVIDTPITTSSLWIPSTPHITQLLQAQPHPQVLSNGSVLPTGQVVQSNPTVVPGTHVLPSQVLQGGQVLHGNQVLSGSQLLASGGQVLTASHLLNAAAGSSQVFATTTSIGTINTPTAPFYVAPTTQTVQTQQQTTTIPQHGHPNSQLPFSVLSKSPITALPRTSPSHSYNPATPSPHTAASAVSPATSYTTRSPAPSPHNSIGALKSPASMTPSPAPTPTQSVQSSVNTATATLTHQPTAVSNLVPSVVGGMGVVPGIVSLPQGTQVVLSQPGVTQQVTAGVKQVVQGGPIIQLVSSPQSNQPRQPLASQTPKPIQPKQPQLLPKPPHQTVITQPTPPPAGKTLIGSRPVTACTQQQIVLGAAGQPHTLMTGQHGLSSIVINPSMFQSGLQQPLLIQQPNGVQLLVRPTSSPSGAGQLILPMPGQHQIAKPPPHQAVVIPSNGQGPALVIPQGFDQI